MYKEVLRSIENIEIWPVIALAIFFTFFVLLLWKVFSTSKEKIEYVENLPLHDEGIHESQNRSKQ